jgi:putative MATE family efflux protein
MEISWQDRDKISDQPMGRALVALAVPSVLMTFFTMIFEIVDMFWIGKLGPVAIAALSASSFFVWMLRGLGLIVATGAIALVARRTGEKDEHGLLRTISHALGSSFIFSILVMAIVFPLALVIFQWLKLEPAVAAFSEEYTIVFLSGLIFVYVMMTLEFVIRGVGDTRRPMIITGIALLLNVVLDPVFIFILGMGLRGAAYATILSQAAGALLMAGILFKKIPALKKIIPAAPAARPGLSVHASTGFVQRFYTMIKIGGPIGVSDAGFSFIYVLLSGIISIFGKEPLAAIGIAHRFEALLFFICLGFSMAVAPMVGQYLGAGQPELAKKSVYLSLKITTVIMVVLAIIYVVLAPVFFRLFTADPAIIRHGAAYLRIAAVSDIFLPLEIILGGAFSGAGDTRPPFFITLPITFLRIPFAYLFAVLLEFGPVAIWLSLGITTFFKGMLLLYVFSKGRWAQKKI